MRYFLLTAAFLLFPIWTVAETAAPYDESTITVYSHNTAENTRRAVRLGYQNFRHRINTPDMTATDTQIAILITTGFQPFFDKLNTLENATADEVARLSPQLSDQFSDLLARLAKLLVKNQQRYTNPLFLQDHAALQETLLIVQEAIERGTF